MSRGFFNGTCAGDVGDPIVFGQTNEKVECCSFMLAIQEKDQKQPTWVKVNVYGGNVAVCRERLKRGAYVVVGRLKAMNRPNRQTGHLSTEFRAEEIVFPRQEQVG